MSRETPEGEGRRVQKRRSPLSLLENTRVPLSSSQIAIMLIILLAVRQILVLIYHDTIVEKRAKIVLFIEKFLLQNKRKPITEEELDALIEKAHKELIKELEEKKLREESKK